MAARVSYELYVGKIEPGDVISRRCGNDACVNPSHLVARRKQWVHSVEKGGSGTWWPKGGNVPLTAERLRELAQYDPDTGKFIWRVTRGNHAVRGMPMGRQRDGAGRIGVQIERRLYRLHRLAWLYVYGKWPSRWIDHINGDASDNRITNLREATRSQNAMNQKLSSRNTSGFKGVSRDPNGRWRATITKAGKAHWLGVFDDPAVAHEAYAAAARNMHGEFACISRR